MAATELAVVRDEPAVIAPRDIVDGWVAMASDVFRLAAHICDTDFVPKAYRGNAPAVAAAILTGRELNMGPMMSLKHVQVVEGNPSLSAEYKRARVLAAGHEFGILEWTSTRCRVRGRRRGTNEPPLEVTYTMDDARLAGLVRERSGWVKRPRRMLFARAGTDLCDALFSDVVNGLPTAELLAEGTDEDEFAAYSETNGQETAKPAARTARRRTAAAGDDTTSGSRHAAAGKDRAEVPADGAGEGGRTQADPRAAGAASPRGAQPLPPLPGEDDETPAAAVPDETPASGPAAAAGPEPLGPEDRPEFGTERHRKLVGIIWQHLGRLGYPGKDKETDEEKAQRLADVAALAGIAEIGSTSDLDLGELSAAADTLARCRDRGALDALLGAARQAGEGDG